jgi:type I restriction enzyme M protein
MNNHNERVNFIWSIADLIRDSFKRGKYQDVMLPLTVLRRLDCVLAPTKQQVLETNAKLKGKLENLTPQLAKASGFSFYNTSLYDFEKLTADAPNLASNLRNYINGFSDNMREVIEKFDFDNTINKLVEADLLFKVLERFKNVDLHPDKISNEQMGYIFEELIRKFNESLDENPGEHFTPREVIRLMVNLILTPDEKELNKKGVIRTVYDPCSGTGGMLTIAKGWIAEKSPQADIFLFGQEVNPETFAVCKSDLYMKSAGGQDADNIQFGSTLSNDRHPSLKFDYMLANPPYGKDWKRDEDSVKAESERGSAGRFGAGLPRISDGQMLFMQHMLSKMKPAKEGGTRLAIVMNGSPLFTGDAGGGESEIRRWILENDWLEAIVALPEKLFYNTGIATYVWVLTNRKEEKRKGKVQMINAIGFWEPMRKSMGDKRREISADHIQQITKIYEDFKEGESSKIFASTNLGYRKITIDRPLKLNFQTSQERIARLKEERAFQQLAVSKKKYAATAKEEEKEGRKLQDAILEMLKKLPETLYKDRVSFKKELDKAVKSAGIKLTAAIEKLIMNCLSERDETAVICSDKDGKPEADTELRDTENVPLLEDINEYFKREVRPHVPDAWINTDVMDLKDGKTGKVGYEINFNRYFYKYTPPRALEEIEAEILALEKETEGLLQEIVRAKGG